MKNTVANDNKEPTGKVIQFPKKFKPQKEIKIDNSDMEMREALMWADHLTEGLVMNLVNNLEDNEVYLQNKNTICDIGFLIEYIKSMIYRTMDIDHPMQELTDLFVTRTTHEGKEVTMINMEFLQDVIDDLYGDKDEEE